MRGVGIPGRSLASTTERLTGHPAVLVGGAAAAIYTAGACPSADFDIVAADDAAFAAAMRAHGFIAEDRPDYLRAGFYHPDHPQFGVQQVSGALFDGLSDRGGLLHIVVRATRAGKTPIISPY